MGDMLDVQDIDDMTVVLSAGRRAGFCMLAKLSVVLHAAVHMAPPADARWMAN